MQIILPQSELEAAIAEYVHGIMNIKEGNTMTIDLRAGRGLDGFTATVDIVKSGTAIPAKTVVPAAVIPTPVPVEAPIKAASQPVTKEEPVTKEDAPVATKSEQQEAVSEAKEEAPAEAPSSVRRPLFGTLKKPE